ncbi:ankyrin repeat-containing domain protein [Flagelloscypha sp. PMI_526]|nr:ankyrin repeat-containing domain protein [Flagelloscypha sp. PMI_526]
MTDTKDANRLRAAVKDNNLFLVKRLIGRTNLRNPDPAPRHFTSLAWAAILGHEETFEFLLTAGHDDEELSKDSENNTILMLLADTKPSSHNVFPADPGTVDAGSALRMARLYYDRFADIYPQLLDWSDRSGKTALHYASLKGNEELVRMLCDLGADFDLTDNQGNTPLHYASSWGHIPVVQLLIEKGCQFNARNNEGFTASDYAYSFGTRDTLQDTARLQFEANKKSRRAVFAQAAAQAERSGRSTPDRSVTSTPTMYPPATVPSRSRDIRGANPRLRSGSGTSRTTNTSDSGDHENNLAPSTSSISASSSPSQPSASSSLFPGLPQSHGTTYTNGGTVSRTPSQSQTPTSALSPIASRMRERDADAMEKYLSRNRSGSSSTDHKSNTSTYSTTPSQEDSSPLTPSGASTPRKLRPSASASQLRGSPQDSPSEHRSRPNGIRIGHPPLLTRSSSTSGSKSHFAPVNGHRPIGGLKEADELYIGPPSQFAHFPDPPPGAVVPPEEVQTPTTGRRLPFHILTKSSGSANVDSSSSSSGHRRGISAASVR